MRNQVCPQPYFHMYFFSFPIHMIRIGINAMVSGKEKLGHCSPSYVIVTGDGHGCKCKTTPAFSVSASSLAHCPLYASSALAGQDK